MRNTGPPENKRRGHLLCKAGSLTTFCAIVTFISCGKFEYSPYVIENQGTDHGLTAINLARIAAQEPADDDTVTILYSGDSQRFYEEQVAIVEKANSIPGIDFFILAGDIVDFGLVEEFNWTVQRMNRLNMPWLTVIGNHDHQANGTRIYQEVFGALNYSFTYKGYKFLFHDTNGREYANNGSVPDLGWIGAQLQDTVAKDLVMVSHVPPMNGDFDPALVQPYTQLLASDPRMRVSLHAHQGSYYNGHPYGPQVQYIVGNAMANPEFVLLKLFRSRTHGGGLEARLIRYD